jgi:hypothetical protein
MLFKALADDFSFPANDWKDRFKEFSEKMRTGDIFEAAEVLKHLTYLSHIKPLSFREQRMLERSRYLVISELAAVCRQPECNIEPRVEQAFPSLRWFLYAVPDLKLARITGAGAHGPHCGCSMSQLSSFRRCSWESRWLPWHSAGSASQLLPCYWSRWLSLSLLWDAPTLWDTFLHS